MKTPPPSPETVFTIGEIRTFAIGLWGQGYKGDKSGRPVDPSKPLIPSVIAQRFGVGLAFAIKANHCVLVWSLGRVPVGQFDKL